MSLSELEVSVLGNLNAEVGACHCASIRELSQNGTEIILVTSLSSKQRDGLVWHSIFSNFKESISFKGKGKAFFT